MEVPGFEAASAAPAAEAPPPPVAAPAVGAPRRPLPLWPVGLLVAAAAALWLRPSPSPAPGPAPLPYSEPAGLTARGELFASMDAPRLLVYTFDAAGVVRSIEKLPHAAAALAWSQSGLWTAASGGQICLHETAEGFPAKACYVNAERRPSALHWDGRQLWLADARTETVQSLGIAGAALAMQSQHSLPGVRAAGLHVEGDALWVLDAEGGRLLRYELKTLAAPEGQAPLSAWTEGSRPAGFVVKEGRLNLLLERPARLRSVPLSELAWSKP